LLGEWSESLGEYTIFTGIAVFTIVIGALILIVLKPLKRLTHGAEDNEGEEEFHEAEGFEIIDQLD